MKNFRAPQGFQGSDSAWRRLRRRACTVARPQGGLNFGGGEGREGEALRPRGEETSLPSSPQALSHRRPGSVEPAFPGSAAARLRMRGPGRASRERAAPERRGRAAGTSGGACSGGIPQARLRRVPVLRPRAVPPRVGVTSLSGIAIYALGAGLEGPGQVPPGARSPTLMTPVQNCSARALVSPARWQGAGEAGGR